MIPQSVEVSRVRHPASGDVRRSSEITDSDAEDDIATVRERYAMKRTQLITLILVVISNILLGMELSLYGPLFPKFAESKGLTPTIYALIRGTYYLFSLLFLPLLCIQFSRFSPKQILFVGSIFLAFSGAVLGTLEDIEPGAAFTSLAFISRGFEGIGAGIIKASTYMIIITQFPSAIWTTFTTLDIFFAFGLTVGPIFGGYLFEVKGFSFPYYIISGLVFVTAIITAITLPKPGFPNTTNTKHVWNVFKKPYSILYFCVVFVCFYYTGFLEVTLEPHLRSFNLRALFVGLIFPIPEAFYCALAAGWGLLMQKGQLSPVMITFVAIVISIPSMLLIGPVDFINLDTKIYLIAIALVIKGISQAPKVVCSFYGAYIDTVAQGLPNDVSTHMTVYMIHGMAMTFGALIGSSTSGVICDTIGFKDGTLVLLGLEAILIPGVLGYGLLRRYRRPINFHSRGERTPLLHSRS